MINAIYLLVIIIVVLIILLAIVRSTKKTKEPNTSVSSTVYTPYTSTVYTPYASTANIRYENILNPGRSYNRSNSRSSSRNNSRSLNSNIYSYSNDNIKILTYNINWKAMNGTECYNSNDGKLCRDNVVNIIDDNKPFDFIALQEAGKYKDLVSKSRCLSNMGSRPWTPGGKETIVTFWDKKYGNVSFFVEGYLHNKNSRDEDVHDQGRPYQMLFFEKRRICFINIHQGHTTESKKTLESNTDRNKEFKLINSRLAIDINSEEKQIKRDGNIIFQKSNSKATIIDQLGKYRIIIAGDFNTDLLKLKLFNKILQNKDNRPKTCCNKSEFGSMSYSYDHVLDSDNKVVALTTCNFEYPASDHAPLIAEIKV